MKNYIESIKVNILDLLTESIIFNPKLNIISGENGTLKTKLLEQIWRSTQSNNINPRLNPQATDLEKHIPKAGFYIFPTDKSNRLKIQVISPKRNSERRSVEETINYFRSQGVNFESITNKMTSPINDKTFELYPAFGELFYAVFDKACKDGGNQKEKMIEVADDFNKIIKQVFDNYELIAIWNDDLGKPHVNIRKNKLNNVPIENLSLGEQEILSIVCNIHTTKDSFDLFLIDEPEVHLNWHLEDKLFDYFDTFCETYDKQMIVVTHSRAIFKPKFLDKIQFLYWNDRGKISVGNKITDEIRQKISGEIIETINLGGLAKTTFFVEDQRHNKVIKALSKKLSREVFINECGNSASVKLLYEFSLNNKIKNTFFLVDGDNKPRNHYPQNEKFIHLEKYCIENYLFDFSIISEVTGKSNDEIQHIIFELLRLYRNQILGKNKHFNFLFDRIKAEDITTKFLDNFDASIIYTSFLKKVSLRESQYLERYINICVEQEILKSVFPKNLIEAIENAIDVL